MIAVNVNVNLKIAAAAIMDFVISQIWRRVSFRDWILSPGAEFRAKMAEFMAVKAKFEMAAATILDFVRSQIWQQICFRDPILNLCVNFGANTRNSARVIKISSKIQNGGCPSSWIIICNAGPPTKTTWWP